MATYKHPNNIVPGTEALMHGELPTCVICNMREAYADALIPSYGKWGYVCEVCFEFHDCNLGTGRGQKLFLATLEESQQ